MSRNPKLFLHQQTYELCFRTEEGLPFVAAPYMKRLLLGYLAAAQTLYPITICHCVFMANHVHLIIVVDNPENVPRFCEYFKRESAHAVNRLWGRVGKTVWSDGYDSPILLDAEKVISRVVYLYNNPTKANLVESIDEYNHINSWSAFLSGTLIRQQHKRVPRDKIPVVPNRKLRQDEQLELDLALLEASEGDYYLEFSPNAWLSCFEESKASAPEHIRAEILKRVRSGEKSFSSGRKSQVLGAKNLANQLLRAEYTPTKRSKKMICLGSTKGIRVTYIAFFKRAALAAKEAIRQIKAGISNTPVPSSFFHPGGFLSSTLCSWALPLPLA